MSRQRSGWELVLPLALAQFVASYAATNMNVAIGDIARDLHTNVIALQTTITLFTLTMAALMIPGSKLTDIWGRRRCFLIGLVIYGAGAILAASAPGIGVLTVGYSLLGGVGSALLIPPIYILVTVAFEDLRTRAKFFGVVSGAAGLGAAAGPLLGGLITSALSWRASFVFQVAVVGVIIMLARRITEPPRPAHRPTFDLIGALLSAAGLLFVVLGVLCSSTYGWFASRRDFKMFGTVLIPAGGISPVWVFLAIGALTLGFFYRHIRRTGPDPLLRPDLFRNRTANLGLGTQLMQWLVLQGAFFVISVYLQQARGYSAIQTGLLLTPATIGLLISSAAAERFARRHPQRWLVVQGFVLTTVGLTAVLLPVGTSRNPLIFAPGLLVVGLGVGAMLTSSVTIVQSSFPDSDQSDISGLSRSVSNLGSSLGTALAGSVLVAAADLGDRNFRLALVTLVVVGLLGLIMAIKLPKKS